MGQSRPSNAGDRPEHGVVNTSHASERSAGNRPRVTIGLPVRNGVETIERCVASLLAQSFTDFEIIVSDNASTDQTRELVEGLARSDDRIRLVSHPENVGVMENFRHVLSLAQTPYFMWAAADDSWAPSFLDRLVHELDANPDADLAMPGVKRVWSTGRTDVIRWAGAADPGRMSPYRLAAEVAAGKPYHLYIYGLHRTGAIRSAFEGVPRIQGPDRLLMCQHALAFRWRYVDEVLYVRHMATVPHAVRHQDAPKVALRRSAPWSPAVLMCAAVPFLLRSRVIPRSRKIYVPLLLPVFARRAALSVVGSAQARLRMGSS